MARPNAPSTEEVSASAPDRGLASSILVSTEDITHRSLMYGICAVRK